jgi:hypothetical protein
MQQSKIEPVTAALASTPRITAKDLSVKLMAALLPMTSLCCCQQWTNPLVLSAMVFCMAAFCMDLAHNLHAVYHDLAVMANQV